MDEMVNNYNSTQHSSIKMTPVEPEPVVLSLKKNEAAVYRNLYLKRRTSRPKPKLKIDVG